MLIVTDIPRGLAGIRGDLWQLPMLLPSKQGKKYRADFYSPLNVRHGRGGRPSDLLLNLALATKLSLVAGPRAAARRHEGAPKDVLDAPVQRAIMTDCSADAARPNLPEP